MNNNLRQLHDVFLAGIIHPYGWRITLTSMVSTPEILLIIDKLRMDPSYSYFPWSGDVEEDEDNRQSVDPDLVLPMTALR